MYESFDGEQSTIKLMEGQWELNGFYLGEDRKFFFNLGEDLNQFFPNIKYYWFLQNSQNLGEDQSSDPHRFRPGDGNSVGIVHEGP